ncbi:aldehyde dehydrogenase family protein [Alicyclobacillus herbarius]|uniref:aldehyde dehydrogenase family protein n=1 Tax=Alicyclobacillus herbarius TaxID=122960 RepID=UPI0004274D84|nr:aldehyde dehydrogenase family protein [Alicyclobacillus herbarius]
MTERVVTQVEDKVYGLFIGGEFVPADQERYFEVYNPATGQPIAKVAKATKADVDKAVQAARQAFEDGNWSRFTVAKRARVLNEVARLMRERLNDLVELEVLNTGKTVNTAKGQILQAIEDFEFYASASVTLAGQTVPMPNGFFTYTLREPVGVCAQIIPWNYPLMMAAWKLAPALAAGCTVILKPASYTPLTALELARICKEAGVPDGVVNVITGSGAEVGAYMCEHPGIDKVAFTGDTETGRGIMSMAAGTVKRVSLELGGKSANLIFSDADLDAAVDGSLHGIFYNSGQSCEARSRLFVHEDVYEEFMSRFLDKVKRIQVGDPFDPAVHMGAIISESQLEVIDGYVRLAEQEGAKVTYGGRRPEGTAYENGYWYLPTVIEGVRNEMRVAQEEIFGPVVVVMKFSSEEEAIQLANDSMYGLAGAVWTTNHARAHRVASRIRSGIVMVNSPISAFPGVAFGGFKQSGFGRELAVETLNLYTETKSVVSYIGTQPLNPLGVR